MTATATRVWDKIEDEWRYEEPKPAGMLISPRYGGVTRADDHTVRLHVMSQSEVSNLFNTTDHSPMPLENITAQAVRRQFGG